MYLKAIINQDANGKWHRPVGEYAWERLQYGERSKWKEWEIQFHRKSVQNVMVK